MRNNKGISELIILLSVVVIIAIAVLFMFFSKPGSFMGRTETNMNQVSPSPEVSAEPVSESTESAVIEQEIEQTVVTSPLDELDAMESEAEEL